MRIADQGEPYRVRLDQFGCSAIIRIVSARVSVRLMTLKEVTLGEMGIVETEFHDLGVGVEKQFEQNVAGGFLGERLSCSRAAWRGSAR